MLRIEKRGLSDLVYEKLRAMIDEGTLTAGAKVNKPELAERLGVSQTPINDALSRLAGEKLIEQRSRQGFYIRSYAYAELAPLYELRAALEGMAVRLGLERGETAGLEGIRHAFDGFDTTLAEDRWSAYRQADHVFHRSIIEFSGNPFLIDLAKTSAILTRSNLRGLVRPPSETLPEHKAILEAIGRGDSLAAQELVILHMLRSRDKLRTLRG
jgi:DNA-binding GntR family transcriptional regulator